MIRNLLATTALATLLASSAYAQTATAPAEPAAPVTTTAAPAAPIARADGSLATNIIGETVYDGTGDDAQNIGKVSDVVFDKDGNAKSVIIGVGGFLGIGEKDVAYDFGKLQWAEKNGDRWLVAQTTKDELTAQPAFDVKAYDMAAAPADTQAAPAPAAAPAATDTTAAAPAATAPAATDTTMAPAAPATADNTVTAPKADGSLASNIIGEDVYNGTSDDAQKIGDVNDIVIAKDGKAQSLIIGVGGFLGIGEKSVAYDFAKATWAAKNSDRWLVAQTTKEELQAQPDFERRAYDPAPAPVAANDQAAPAAVAPATDTAQNTAPATTAPAATAPATDTAQNAPAATAPADNTVAAAPAATDTTTAPDATSTAAIDKSQLTAVQIGDIRSEDLVGTTVYGANDTRVGEIGDIALNGDKVDAVIIDVGGFLGIGEKEVAVGMDNLQFMTDKDGNRYLYTNFTKEQLEAQAAYDKATYAQKRDDQRLIIAK